MAECDCFLPRSDDCKLLDYPKGCYFAADALCRPRSRQTTSLGITQAAEAGRGQNDGSEQRNDHD